MGSSTGFVSFGVWIGRNVGEQLSSIPVAWPVVSGGSGRSLGPSTAAGGAIQHPPHHHCGAQKFLTQQPPGVCPKGPRTERITWHAPCTALWSLSFINKHESDKPSRGGSTGTHIHHPRSSAPGPARESEGAVLGARGQESRPPFVTGKRLSEVCTWGIGGPAKYFIEVHTVEEMEHTLGYCRVHEIPCFVLGKGSNCLFDDRGYDGCIILNRVEFVEERSPGVFRVGSGHPFNALGVLCSKQGFAGLEFACGIPGTVGGAVFMNAGADGQETADVLQAVEIVTWHGQRRTLLKRDGDLQYSYRRSPFQSLEEKVVVTAATFELQPCTDARQRQILYMERRRRSQPVSERSAGCVFQNPQGHASAGAMIDRLGLKGHSVGDACVSSLHANFLVNKGNSKAADMLALIADIKQRVRAELGVDLHEEILYVPFR